MSGWDALRRELDAWGEAGATASLWWRDDDARRLGPALERLIAVAGPAPLALAIVPADADPALAGLPGDIRLLPHGWRHVNHAGPGEKKAEFGPHRPAFERLADVALGWERLRLQFGPGVRPVFVPPWNRIEEAFVPSLANAGIRALSRFGPRRVAEPAPGIAEVNCHVDIIDWRGSRGFVGEPAALGALVAHLGARRQGAVDPGEPTGLMTHHAVHDAACWRFLERLLAQTLDHGAARWLSADEAATFAT